MTKCIHNLPTNRTGASQFLLNLIGMCLATMVLADDWPQWLGPDRDGVWKESGILKKFPKEGPNVLWRTKLGAGYTGPAVANGKVYIMDRHLAKGATKPANPFQRHEIPGTDRVLCLNEADGKTVWEHQYKSGYTVSYPSGPRTTPIVSDGKVYCLGTEGELFCLDASNGNVLWSMNFNKEFDLDTPLWGYAAHPLLDGDRLICLAGGQGSTAVAFDKNTGKELWRALSSKEPGYSPPMIFHSGGKRQLIVWHPESVNSLNPETGEVYWSEPWKLRSGLSIPTARKMGDYLFFTAFYNGSTMFRLNSNRPTAEAIWQSAKASEKDTTELHSIMSTPFLEDGHIYGVCSYGQLRCIKAETGERLWETFEATTTGKPVRWANAFLVKHEDRFFISNELGDLIIAKLSPSGYEKIDRVNLLKPTNADARGRMVVWSHPAFANRNIYTRNDEEIIAVSLAE